MDSRCFLRRIRRTVKKIIAAVVKVAIVNAMRVLCSLFIFSVNGGGGGCWDYYVTNSIADFNWASHKFNSLRKFSSHPLRAQRPPTFLYYFGCAFFK